MKTKRIIIITIVLLLLAAILFGLSWYMNKKSGTPSDKVISFREFLGIGQRLNFTDTDQDLGSDFETNPLNEQNYDKNNNGIADWLEDLNGNGITDGLEDLNGNGIADQLEDTNNNGIPDIYELPNTDIGGGQGNNTDGGGDTGTIGDGGEPGDTDWDNDGDLGDGDWPGDDNWGGGTNPGDGGTIGDGGNIPGGNTGDTGSGTGQTEGSTISFSSISGDEFDWGDNFQEFTEEVGTASCRADDINIQFTEEELAILRAFEERYNQISAELYSREAVAEQRNLHGQLKLKYYRLAELNNFCEQISPRITDPKMQKRVPTPFWHDTNRDSKSFTNYTVSTSDLNNYGITAGNNNPNNKANSVDKHWQNFATLFERMFRVNIW